MKSSSAILLLIIPILFLTACVSNETANSDTVKQSEIYQSYTLSYSAADMELSATAYFRFGGSNGTTLLLTKPSNITLDGVEMAMGKSMFTGSYYEAHLQNPFKGSYTFKFTDTEKKVYTNTASISTIELTDFTQTASKKKGFAVGFKGKPLANGERITLTLQDNNYNTRTISTDIVGSTAIQVKPDDLKDFPVGETNIYFTREISSSLTEATHLGGSINITYSSKKQGIKIID